ncbi:MULTISPECIES: VIT1/CCC1 transporter family protein [Chryseobacterium]|uniref:VIT1/CCC1 family predicted Fe2+/Mn2+ transporter n=1 Tax=Chryseobacterium camelliae TaxID=1265445 RepID=A0ABU0TE28_9FLAO|nr:MULTISPECIES: VIT family protein [Chryseobacterium]MDT3406869.1 VIT1/CCC1 family predicted Fe2+/Mn2+ transporter [Pseudacidovorax intermedius]MDQ1095335.1 VIT1/CCC1 family predicted Fe2+/Mn2+ transporter [Chryseobacterium camelliae]MDQ1099274.1 VIT1/CCC1 family predicted Fe2+/Mn2+ transporter [Chryseobacterium sp. SORGH_AS_1048]MDR6086623.1 VIT1/CCC1 family predicted Fe2+/Mn2+ transporter [Chryseobacterium sp. SORGH_AS_0909]MDR6130993.1 VIT1/CCC1 family predicted Fe2+/Mn2+ transporter [Chry
MHHHLEKHYVNRVGWLRAAVLGANDGLLSTTSIVIGVAAAQPERNTIILAALAGMIAGALSMAAGEYVSVSSQEDTEKADLAREKRELEEMPEIELRELAKIYEGRGVSKETAMQVAIELTAHDALEAHARDELGINEITQANPTLAALASFGSFALGALLPFIVSLVAPLHQMVYFQYGFSIIFLMLLGAVSAKTGGAPVGLAMLRICFWGTAAMGITALVGHLFGTSV